jgi:hypothetical protein
VLSEHLGARPLMVVEWKRLLREVGVEEIHVEDWSDEETSFRPTVVKPFPDFAELFSLGERLGILRRAWRRWGWRGVSSAIGRENEVHRLLTNERILGLDLLRGRKVAAEVAPELPSDPVSASVAALPHPSDSPDESDEERSEADTTGLPLFGGDVTSAPESRD